MRTTYLGALGIAAGFLVVAVAIVAGGLVDDRATPLWNPAFLGAASLGPAYAAPRMSLRTLFVGGGVLGLLYGGMVLAAAALTGRAELLGPARLLTWAISIGALPPLAAGLLYRWLERRSGRSAPPIR